MLCLPLAFLKLPCKIIYSRSPILVLFIVLSTLTPIYKKIISIRHQQIYSRPLKHQQPSLIVVNFLSRLLFFFWAYVYKSLIFVYFQPFWTWTQILPNVVLQNHFIPRKRYCKVNHAIFRTALFSTGTGTFIPKEIDCFMSDFAALKPQVFQFTSGKVLF